MPQTSPAAPIHPRSPAGSQESTLLDPFLRLAGNLRNAHALIVVEHGLDLMCGLIQRGSAAATILRIGDKPDAGDYRLALVPYAIALPSHDDPIRLARRSLTPSGRLVVGARDSKAATALARRLRLNGFTNLRSTHLPGLALLRTDLRSLS
jgi:hypothetical protein